MIQKTADWLFTELCKLKTMSKQMQCHEAQLYFKAILETLKQAGIKPKVPNYWSDGFCFFPVEDLLEFFHKNGWEHAGWFGDADCRDCFDREECKFCIANPTGKTTQEKCGEQTRQKMTNKLIILKILKEHAKSKHPITMERLHWILLFAQANGVPLSYTFMKVKGGVIPISNHNIANIAEKTSGSD